jgi:hypothetical protein
MAELIPPVPNDPNTGFILRNWLLKIRTNINKFAVDIAAILVDLTNVISTSNPLTVANISSYVNTNTISNNYIANTTITAGKMNVSQLSAITADLGSITAGQAAIGSTPAISGNTMTGTGMKIYTDGRFAAGNSSKNLVWNGTDLYLNGGDVSIGSSPAISGTTMTGSGARIYNDGRFSIGKAAQNLTYDGSDLYLNGFYANNNSSYSTSIIYSGAAVNFTAKDFNGVGEFPSGTLQKSSVFCTFNGQLGVKINTATQRMLRIDASLTIEKWDGSSWVSPQTVASLNDTRITGTDTAVAYPFTITIAKPFNIGSFSAGSLYRMYIRAQVTCYSLAGALAAEMTQVYLDGETNFVELKI